MQDLLFYRFLFSFHLAFVFHPLEYCFNVSLTLLLFFLVVAFVNENASELRT